MGDFNMHPSHASILQSLKRFIHTKNVYHTFLDMAWWKLALLSLFVYFSLHLFFGFFYWLGGVWLRFFDTNFFYVMVLGKGTLDGKDNISFLDCFFFSIQTMTTIGYGK